MSQTVMSPTVMSPTTFVLRPFALLGLGSLLAFTIALETEDPRVVRGRLLFDEPFHLADGVGAPELNADSCRACHSDPIVGGAGPLELNVSRFGRDNGGLGPYADLPGGQGLSRLRPPLHLDREAYPPEADLFEQRQTPSILGDGLVDTIPDAAILANEDPLDLDQDGIRGVARRLTIGSVVEIGRFGWKAQIPRLGDFVRDATAGELGLTTTDDGRGFGMRTDNDAVADPELTADDADDMAHFLASLPAPQRTNPADPTVQQGLRVFLEVGCAKCHVPNLYGIAGPVPLFSNLLLHNIMPAGFRGMAEPGAAAGFYRTPPLWGISHTAPYMHDGRAETLLDAILAHDGEASQVRSAFQARPPADRSALLAFLQDL